jgi:hypothetical protein
VVSTTTVSAAGPLVGSVAGAPVVGAAAIRVAAAAAGTSMIGDNLAVAVATNGPPAFERVRLG